MSETPPLGLSASTARLTDAHPPRASQRQEGAPESESNQMPRTKSWETAVELIHCSNSILVVCHVSPDGDAIGSLLGLGLGLRILNKTPALACEDALPEKFSFLPGFESVVNAIDSSSFDLVIALDSSDPSRLGNVYSSDQLAGIPLINIDHHITNLYFGNVNLVDAGAASAAEVVLQLLDRLGVSIDQDTATSLSSRAPTSTRQGTELGHGRDRRVGGAVGPSQASDIATCLLTGIVTDTVGFRTANVTPRVMKAVVRLMEAGASLSQVTHYAFNQRPLSDLGVLALGLNRMQVEDGLAWSEITLADRRACGPTRNSDVGLVGMLVRTKEVHVAVVFTEKENNHVEISFRAAPGFDVAQLALSLDGGGHRAAAGCTVEGPLDVAKARVLPMLRADLEKQLKSPAA